MTIPESVNNLFFRTVDDRSKRVVREREYVEFCRRSLAEAEEMCERSESELSELVIYALERGIDIRGAKLPPAIEGVGQIQDPPAKEKFVTVHLEFSNGYKVIFDASDIPNGGWTALDQVGHLSNDLVQGAMKIVGYTSDYQPVVLKDRFALLA